MVSLVPPLVASIATIAILLPSGHAQAGVPGGMVPALVAEPFEPVQYQEPVRPHRTYRVNRYGYGHYVHGPNGSYGGYPAGSAGARELQIRRQQQCRDLPESC